MRKFLMQIGKFLVSGLLIGLIVRQIGIQELIDLMMQINRFWLFIALTVFTFSHLLGSFQWWILLRHQQVKISIRTTIGFYFVGLFFNNFLISQLGGDLFRVADIHRYAKDDAAAVTTVFLDRLAGLFVMSTLAIFSAPWILFQGRLGPEMNVIYSAILLGWVFIILLLFNYSFTRPVAKMIRKIMPGKVMFKTREIYWKIHKFGRQPSLLFRVITISLVVQSCRILTHYFLARSLGVQVSMLYFFLFIPIIAIIASMPISLGGLGVREQTGVLLFATAGMASSQAASMEFLAYLVAIVTSIPGGFVFAFRRKVEKEKPSGSAQLEEVHHEMV